MPRKPAKAAEIMALLVPWLESISEAYYEQPESGREPTLPATNDAKVNVTAVTKALGLKDADKQYFHRDRALAAEINLVAEFQGLQPIGSRALDDEAADGVKAKIARMSASEKKASEELADALHRLDALTVEAVELRLEVERLQAQLDELTTTGQPLVAEDS